MLRAGKKTIVEAAETQVSASNSCVSLPLFGDLTNNPCIYLLLSFLSLLRHLSPLPERK